jgi:hypothetical protein
VRNFDRLSTELRRLEADLEALQAWVEERMAG